MAFIVGQRCVETCVLRVLRSVPGVLPQGVTECVFWLRRSQSYLWMYGCVNLLWHGETLVCDFCRWLLTSCSVKRMGTWTGLRLWHRQWIPAEQRGKKKTEIRAHAVDLLNIHDGIKYHQAGDSSFFKRFQKVAYSLNITKSPCWWTMVLPW